LTNSVCTGKVFIWLSINDNRKGRHGNTRMDKWFFIQNRLDIQTSIGDLFGLGITPQYTSIKLVVQAIIKVRKPEVDLDEYTMPTEKSRTPTTFQCMMWRRSWRLRDRAIPTGVDAADSRDGRSRCVPSAACAGAKLKWSFTLLFVFFASRSYR
jgi:hypothetical protein